MARPIIICADCGKEKPHHAHGLCRTCYGRQWQHDNPDKVRTYKRRYRKKHVAKRRAYKQRYNEAHREEQREYSRQWYAANKEHVAEYRREWRKANPNYHRRWRRSNRDKCRESERRWREANPEICRAKAGRRYAREAGAKVAFVDEAAIYELYNSTCIYCGKGDKVQLDHIIPLARGGPHSEDNLVVACQTCNASKQHKPLEDWLQTQPRSIAWVA